MESLKFRSILAVFGLVVAFVVVFPTLMGTKTISWWPATSKLNYGLDIQGGLNLVMGVDVEGVVSESTNRTLTSLKEELAKETILATDLKATKASEGEIQVTLGSTEDKVKFEKFLSEKYSSIFQTLNVSENIFTLRYFDAYLIDYKEKVLHQAIETLRNRIDEFGVSEPSISQQGANRILVQLPGMADAERAKVLINTTAKLDFMIASTEKSQAEIQEMISSAEKAGNYSLKTLKYSEYVTRVNQDLKDKLPANTVVYFEKGQGSQELDLGAMPYLLKTDSGLGGDSLDNAFVSYGQYGEPEVALKFNTAGATKFSDITGQNIGQRMAIVLDKIVKSAPNIKDRISGGSAVVTLGGRDRDNMMSEAKMISTALRAGALPATLEQLEERRVGPTLGADSISKAKLASYIGAALVVLFMLVYYKSMGVVATVSLAINILSLFALLASFGATLTLPGIAGIALTVGFAVDANVLVNERIKEELSLGSSMTSAIKEGYHRAMSAILDSNIMTASTATVLLILGTGPVKGFAVTLLIGIATTLFANVFVSKVIVDNLVYKFGFKKLSV